MKTRKSVNAIPLPSPTVLEAIKWAQQEEGVEGVNPILILGPLRHRRLVRLRRLAQWRLRTEHYWSFHKIALAFNGRDHSSVMHLVRLENAARGLPEYYPLQGSWAHISAARHEAHVMRMTIKYAGGASYA